VAGWWLVGSRTVNVSESASEAEIGDIAAHANPHVVLDARRPTRTSVIIQGHSRKRASEC
jgi:hypothetical protein